MELFPGLSEELGRECLLRVHYTSHNNLAAVCRSWKATVKNPKFYEDRKNIGVSEQCICLIEDRFYDDAFRNAECVITVYDPQQGTWETLPRLSPFPGNHHGTPRECCCVCVNRKLVLLGGRNPNSSEFLKYTVFIYDFSSGRWSRGADMPPAVGNDFAYSASPEGFVYVAGGSDLDDVRGAAAAVYNVELDEWSLLPDMTRARDPVFGAFVDGKFFVIGGYYDELANGSDRSADVYDPKTGAWTFLENMWTVAGRHGCTVGSSDGRFHSFEKEQGVKEYDSYENVWRVVGSLPQTLETITYCAPWRDMIFVTGYVEGTGRDNVYYMLKPPPIGCAAAVTEAKFHGEWVAVPILRPQESHVDYDQYILSALTFEI